MAEIDYRKFNNRTRFTLRVAGATNSDNPWARGYSQYVGTYKVLSKKLPVIKRDHGGNIIKRWYWKGVPLDEFKLKMHY